MTWNERRQASIVLSNCNGAARSRCRNPSAPCVPRAISLILSTIGPLAREVAVEHRFVDARQRLEVGDRTLLVDLVHGLADQAEFQHRAVAADEACVGRAAG